jgi:hypothetical protein
LGRLGNQGRDENFWNFAKCQLYEVKISKLYLPECQSVQYLGYINLPSACSSVLFVNENDPTSSGMAIYLIPQNPYSSSIQILVQVIFYEIEALFLELNEHLINNCQELTCKIEKIIEDNLDLFPSPSPSGKIQIKVCLR